MKKQPTTVAKGTDLQHVYKQASYADCKHQLVKIVKAHYAYNGYFKVWGNLFTTEKLRPELNIDFGNLLARCFGIPKEGKTISEILEANTPSNKLMSEESINVSLGEVFDYSIDVAKGSTLIKFNHTTTRDLLYAGVLVNYIVSQMEKGLFGDKEGAFEFNGSGSCKMYSGDILDVVGYVLGVDDEVDKHMESLYTLSETLNPFLKTIDAEIDNGILFTQKIIETYREKVNN